MNLLGLLGAALIVCFLAFVGFKSYFRVSAPQISAQLKEAAPEQNINTSSYGSVLNDSKSQLKGTSQQEADRVQEMEGLR